MIYAVNEEAIKELESFSDVLTNSSDYLKVFLDEIYETGEMQNDTLGPHMSEFLWVLWYAEIKVSEIRIIAEQIKMVSKEYRKILTGNVQAESKFQKTTVDHSEEVKRKYAMAWIKRRREIKAEALQAGKSAEEIQLLLSDAMRKFRENWSF